MFSIPEDVATGVPAIDCSEYGDMFEIETFPANYRDSQRPQGQTGQNLDFSNLFFSDGRDQAFLEQSTRVSAPFALLVKSAQKRHHKGPSG